MSFKITIAALLAAISLSACNTMHGVGQDVSGAGDALSGAATDVQSEL